MLNQSTWFRLGQNMGSDCAGRFSPNHPKIILALSRTNGNRLDVVPRTTKVFKLKLRRSNVVLQHVLLFRSDQLPEIIHARVLSNGVMSVNKIWNRDRRQQTNHKAQDQPATKSQTFL